MTLIAVNLGLLWDAGTRQRKFVASHLQNVKVDKIRWGIWRLIGTRGDCQ
jgi:hypothetical protein